MGGWNTPHGIRFLTKALKVKMEKYEIYMHNIACKSS